MNNSDELDVERWYLPGTRYGMVEMRRRKDGGPMRVANGRRNRPMHRYPSAKTGLSHFCESAPELQDLHHAEVDTRITDFQTQPETYCWQINGVWKLYTPDRREVHSDGTSRIIEVKDDGYAARDPAAAAKLAEAAEICGLLGTLFSVRTRSLIRAEPLYSGVEEIQAHRWTAFTTEQVLCAQELLKHEDLPFGDFIRLLAPPHARPSTFAMMVQRIINIDLSQGLGGRSRVSLVREQP